MALRFSNKIYCNFWKRLSSNQFITNSKFAKAWFSVNLDKTTKIQTDIENKSDNVELNQKQDVVKKKPQLDLVIQASISPKSYNHHRKFDLKDDSQVNSFKSKSKLPKVERNKGGFAIQQSNTYKSIRYPLKEARLANPFPDPVKSIESDTISDQEKADQMQAEVRHRLKSSFKKDDKTKNKRSYYTNNN